MEELYRISSNGLYRDPYRDERYMVFNDDIFVDSFHADTVQHAVDIFTSKYKEIKKERKKAMKSNRKMKVYYGSDKKYRPIPQIKFQGKWLKQLGFNEGADLDIKCEKGKLVITVI